MILSSDNRAPVMSSTSAIRSQADGESLSHGTASTTSRQLLESPGRAARKPLIALMTAVIDLIRSSRLGSVEAMTLFLGKYHVHKSMARDAHVVSRYTDRQGFSIRLSSTKGTKGRDPNGIDIKPNTSLLKHLRQSHAPVVLML